MALKVNDKVEVLATSYDFANTTLATIMDLSQPIWCEVKGINEDGSYNLTGFDQVGTLIPLKAVTENKPEGEGWYIK